MSKLAVWSITERAGENGAETAEPKRVGRSNVGLERWLEDWIVKDVSLIGEGLTLVGRQVSIHDGRLDLLAIDSKDRWVVIEVKPDTLGYGALTQALYYASSLASLNKDELFEKLESDDKLAAFGDKRELSRKLRQHLDNEDEPREIALMVVGAGFSAGLERTNEFLGRFDIPIEVISFEVFQPDNSPKLLIREVIEEPDEPPPPKKRRTVAAIRDRAVETGVVEPFDRFITMSRKAGLAVQPQAASIRIAPPQKRTRFLMYARPWTDANSAGLWIAVGGGQFVEFYSEKIDEQQAEAITCDDYFTGTALNQRLNEIEAFLSEYFPKTDVNEA